MEANKRTASKQVLQKYGLSQEEWQALYYKYEGRCYVCKCSLESKLACVDHEHVKGFKKMPPEEKKKYVRGILCYVCNRLVLQRANTIERMEKAIKYLKRYQSRKTHR